MGQAVRNISPLKSDTTPPYEIIIPAAGVGKRMIYCGAHPLLNITSKTTILQHQLKIIKECLPCDPTIILVTGFQAQKVMDYVPQTLITIENEKYEETNITRSIGMGLRATRTNHVLIIYGDLIFNKYALSSLLIRNNESTIIIDNNYMIQKEKEVGCIVHKNLIQNLWYDLPKKWAQIVLLTGRELELAKKICWNRQYYNLFGFEMLNIIINRGGKFKALQPYKIKSIDIDSVNDILLARKII